MADIVRFDCFEAHLASGLLLKSGLKVSVREQSFQVLAALLEHPGQVVTREELQRRLWRDEVFVDFENNLNTAVARLREALCDSAAHPRFIETLPKHGYRFIAEILETPPTGQSLESAGAEVRVGRAARGWIIGGALALAALIVALVALKVGVLRNPLQSRASRPHIESLAVLPLANFSPDQEQEYFTDGMTEALITELSKISTLKVISRISVMHYKKTDKSVPVIARELGVDAVVEGSVAREGDYVRITVQLIHGATDKHLWAESYERESHNVLILQSEVAEAIAREVKANVTAEEHTRLARTRPVSPEAYEAYLKGRQLWETRTRDGLYKALECFETAIRIDPSYASAYAGLADTYSVLSDNKFIAPVDAFPKARTAAKKALELDDNLAEAHASMALILHAYDWDWAGGEREIDRAIQLNPGYASAHQWRAMFLSEKGHHAEALAEIRRAQSLDPLSQRINANIGNILYVARQYDQIFEEHQKTPELFPAGVGLPYSELGRHEEAIASIRRDLAKRHEPPESDPTLARALALAGKRQEAKKIIESAVKTRGKKYIPAPFIAQVYAALGDKDLAFAWLDRGYEERDSDMEWLLVTPGLDPLRSDPRFAALLHKMNLTPAMDDHVTKR